MADIMIDLLLVCFCCDPAMIHTGPTVIHTDQSTSSACLRGSHYCCSPATCCRALLLNALEAATSVVAPPARIPSAWEKM
eukprot:1446674-Amphidinium_carterae.3